MEIDFSPLLGMLIDTLAAALTAVGVWAVARLGRKLGLEADDRVRLYLDDALARGIGYAREQAKRAAADLGKVELRSTIAAEAASYVIDRVPDAVRHFKLGPEEVKRLVEARLAGE